MRAAPVLLASVVTFAVIEGAVFHTGLYPWILSPDASTGYVETMVRNEIRRPKTGPQVVGIGDSRMLLLPRISNEHTPETGYTFGSIAMAGASPRDWYYMLRDTDPDAHAYHAIVMAMESYDDAEKWNHEAASEADLNYVIARLRVADLWEFSRSHETPFLQWRTARGILLKGLVYKRDFDNLLLHPVERFRYAKLSRSDSFGWYYGYTGPPETLLGFQVDFATKTVKGSSKSDPALAGRLRGRLMDPLPPQTGDQTRYLNYWLGKIHERYRGSPTRLVFLRLPRGGWVRPDQPPYNPHSAVRELAAQPNVTLMDEHLFDSLEKPELFRDELHVNGPGMDRFSLMITQEVSRILGPPR